MNRQKIAELIKKLSGLNWCFFSGFALEIYTKGKREAKDLDILVALKDINIFAKRLNCQAHHRHFKKFNFFVDDYGFETKFLGLEIEVSSGFPKRRLNNGSINKVFQNKIYKKYQGIEVYLEPLEEIIVHKADMFRPKDIKDLKMIKNRKINWLLLKELAKDYGKYRKIMNNLQKIGYKIPNINSR